MSNRSPLAAQPVNLTHGSVLTGLLLPVFPVLLLLATPLPVHGRESCQSAGELSFVCGLRAPEDLVRIPGTRWIIAGSYSEHPSAEADLYLIDSVARSQRPLHALRNQGGAVQGRFACAGPPRAEDFVAHGLSLGKLESDGRTLFVINHGDRESIEVFRLNTSSARPAVHWIGCIMMPEHIVGNSVAA